MSLSALLIPINKQYIIKTSLTPEACQAKLEEIEPVSLKPLFTLHPTKKLADALEIKKTNSAWPFEPVVYAQFKEDSKGTEIKITTALNLRTKFLLYALLESILGALLAIVAASFWIPAFVALAYASLITVITPLLGIIALVVFFRIDQSKRIKAFIRQLSSIFKTKPDVVKKNIPSLEEVWKRSFVGKLLPSVVGVIVGLAVTLGLHTLAFKYWCEGNYKASEKLCRPVLVSSKWLLGSNNSIVADCSYYLAECLRCQGKNKEAKELYMHSMKLMKKHLGANHFYVADNAYNLGRIYDSEKKYKKAEQFYRQTIKIYKTNRWSLAKIQNRLAMLLLKQGKFAEAEGNQRAALKQDRVFGRRTQSVAEDLNDLGVILHLAGKKKEAEELYKEALDIKEQALRYPDISFYATLYNLSALHKDFGRQQEAAKLENLLDDLFKRLCKSKQIQMERKLRYKHLLKLYHYKYEVPHVQTRFNGTIDLEGNY